MRGRHPVLAGLALVVAALAIPAAGTSAAFSSITSDPGGRVAARASFGLTARTCVSDAGGAGCADGTALDVPEDVALSDDGAHAYVASAVSDALAAFTRDPSTGALTPLPGAAACVSDGGSGGACVDGAALNGANAVAVAPGGAHVYVTSRESGAVSAFSRDPGSGAVTQLPGTDACLSWTGDGGACGVAGLLDGAEHVVVSGDGAHVYVAAATGEAVLTFTRDQVTGALSPLPGPAGCTSETGSGGACADGDGLGQPEELAISPDGAHVYVSSSADGAVAAFSRDAGTGALTQLPGTGGCVSETGSGGGCADGVALGGAEGLAISPDGGHVYVGGLSADAVAVFARDAASGVLAQLPGTAGCVSRDGTGGACGPGVALDGAEGVAVSPDGQDVYVASESDGAVAVFARDAAAGSLAQAAGTAACTSATGTGGTCRTAAGLGGAQAVTAGPGGEDLYVAAAGDAVVVLGRTR